jgi:hypothetical protein
MEGLNHSTSDERTGFLEGIPRPLGDDQVVEELDADDVGSSGDALGDFEVIRGGDEAAGWMVVNNDDGGRIGLDGETEYLARVDDGSTEEALGGDIALDYLVGLGKGVDDHVLDGLGAYVLHGEVRYVSGGFDAAITADFFEGR